MRVTWYGQSAFLVEGETRSVFVDPFADMSGLMARGRTWRYPAIEVAGCDLLLVTHEHLDHNGVTAINGSPRLIRSAAGTFDTADVPVVGIASEHDRVAGTMRGANVIYVFQLDGIRVCHLGDFGQKELRPEQLEAIGRVDLLFIPVGGSATIDGAQAAHLTRLLAPRWAVPMHYRTSAIDFLETADAYLAQAATEVVNPARPTFSPTAIEGHGSSVIVVPPPPLN